MAEMTEVVWLLLLLRLVVSLGVQQLLRTEDAPRRRAHAQVRELKRSAITQNA
jgi:hypothetical protein